MLKLGSTQKADAPEHAQTTTLVGEKDTNIIPVLIYRATRIKLVRDSRTKHAPALAQRGVHSSAYIPTYLGIKRPRHWEEVSSESRLLAANAGRYLESNDTPVTQGDESALFRANNNSTVIPRREPESLNSLTVIYIFVTIFSFGLLVGFISMLVARCKRAKKDGTRSPHLTQRDTNQPPESPTEIHSAYMEATQTRLSHHSSSVVSSNSSNARTDGGNPGYRSIDLSLTDHSATSTPTRMRKQAFAKTSSPIHMHTQAFAMTSSPLHMRTQPFSTSPPIHMRTQAFATTSSPIHMRKQASSTTSSPIHMRKRTYENLQSHQDYEADLLDGKESDIWISAMEPKIDDDEDIGVNETYVSARDSFLGDEMSIYDPSSSFDNALLKTSSDFYSSESS